MTIKAITVDDIRFSKFFWVWCDLDGDGLKWELATRKQPTDYDDTTIMFVFADAPTDQNFFTDYIENYIDYPAIPIEESEPLHD